MRCVVTQGLFLIFGNARVHVSAITIFTLEFGILFREYIKAE
jgi:hypothetical protein